MSVTTVHIGQAAHSLRAFSSDLMEPDNLFRPLEQYNIEAALLRAQGAAAKLLDHVDGWQKIYSDNVATIHLRKAGAVHTAEPAVDSRPK